MTAAEDATSIDDNDDRQDKANPQTMPDMPGDGAGQDADNAPRPERDRLSRGPGSDGPGGD